MESYPLISSISGSINNENSMAASSSVPTTSTVLSAPLIMDVSERTNLVGDTDDDFSSKFRKHQKEEFKRRKKHKIDKFDEFEEWVDGDMTLRYSPKDQDARKHLSGWAMRNTNNHNKKVLKKSCLGVFVCSKRCVGPEGERVSVRPATSDRARKKQGEKRCPNPECDGHLMHIQCAGKSGYPVTHFWRPMESIVIFQSKGYHDHPRPDVVKTTSSAKIALLEYHRTHRHERPKEICKKIGVHLHKSFNRVDRVARQLREAQNLLGGDAAKLSTLKGFEKDLKYDQLRMQLRNRLKSDESDSLTSEYNTSGSRTGSFAYGPNGQQAFHSNPSLEQWYQSSNDMFGYGMSPIFRAGSRDDRGMNGQYGSDAYYGGTATPNYGSYYGNGVDDMEFGRGSTYFQKEAMGGRGNDGGGKKATIPLLQNMLKRRQMMKEMKDKTNQLVDGQMSDFFDTDRAGSPEKSRDYYEHGFGDSAFCSEQNHEELSQTKRKAPPLLFHGGPAPKRSRALSESDVATGDEAAADLSRSNDDGTFSSDQENRASEKHYASDSASAAAQKLNDTTSGDLPSLLDFFDVQGGSTAKDHDSAPALKSSNSAFSPTIPSSSQREPASCESSRSGTPPPPPSYSSSVHHQTSSSSATDSSSHHHVHAPTAVPAGGSIKDHGPPSPATGNEQVFSELTNVSHSYSRGTPEAAQQGPTLSQLTSGSHGYGQDEENGTYIDLLVSMYLGNNSNINDKPLSTLKHEFHVYTDTFNKSRAQFMQQDMNQYGYDHYKSSNQYDFASWYESDHWRNHHARLAASQNYHGHAEHNALTSMPFSGHYDYPAMQYPDWYGHTAHAADPMGESSRLQLMSQALNYTHGNSGILYNRSLY